MRDTRVAVVGAGIGGLAAALELAVAGAAVTLFERAAAPGGKARVLEVAGLPVDAGPTVLTMREVFDALFERAGTTLAEHLTLRPLAVLARHAWDADARLDLFADHERSVDAIGDFAGAAEARAYRAFCAEAQRTFETLDASFMRATRPNPLSLAARLGWRRLDDLAAIAPFACLWTRLGRHFGDARLRQLFGRYATYCGSSPFMAPATLMLVAHVERRGVWSVDGGLHALPRALAALAQRRGARLRFGTAVERIDVRDGRAAGVRLADGERFDADAVVFNGDTAALAAGLLGDGLRPAGRRPSQRSLSAVTWARLAHAQGFELARHNVFFGADSPAEFDDLFARRQLPHDPTVYVCAQDRDAGDGRVPGGAERLLCLVNAPALGDCDGAFTSEEWRRCESAMNRCLARCGLTLASDAAPAIMTTPPDFERLYPATGGALYGQASHGWRSAFSRQGARCRLPGLYLAGGSVHPGPGLPMAALSGQIAASCLLADRASMRRWLPAATPGGISTR